MSEEELEPLDPSLASLFGDERKRGQAPAGTKGRVFQRLEASIGAGFDPGGGSGEGGAGGGAAIGRAVGVGTSSLSRLLPVLGAFVIGGAAGGIAVSALTPPRIVYVDRVVMASATAPVAATLEAPSVESPPSAVPSAPVEPSSARFGLGPGRDDTLAKERGMLDVARTALGSGDGARALDAVNRHALEYPRGQMSEEREAIAVQALVKLGRRDDAAARGARFQRRYPNSVLGPVVDAALGVGIDSHEGVALP